MRKMLLTFLLMIFVIYSNAAVQKKATPQKKSNPKPLNGLVVILDPGHGGKDSGANGSFGDGVAVAEDSHCYDTALRVERLARSQGAAVYLTVRNPKQPNPINNDPSEPLPSDGNSLFTLNGQQVKAGNEGILTRMRYANKILAEHPSHRVVFIALHFDETGDKTMQGAHLITPRQDSTPKLAEFLADSFRQAGRIRTKDGEEWFPILHSGDKSHGIRHLMVLRGQSDPFHKEYNHVSQKVLLEMGNFNNPADVWRIRDPKVRDNYAQAVLAALLKVNKLPAKECR